MHPVKFVTVYNDEIESSEEVIAKFEAAAPSERIISTGARINRGTPRDKLRPAIERQTSGRIIGIFQINCLVTSVSRKAHKIPVEHGRASNINYAFLETLALCCPSHLHAL